MIFIITNIIRTKCESLNKTMDRLNKALEEANIIQESYMCVSAKKTEIKEKLKEACRSETRVQIARKYCLEEHNGKYYCLKDGKCFGQLCRGCVKASQFYVKLLQNFFIDIFIYSFIFNVLNFLSSMNAKSTE